MTLSKKLAISGLGILAAMLLPQNQAEARAISAKYQVLPQAQTPLHEKRAGFKFAEALIGLTGALDFYVEVLTDEKTTIDYQFERQVYTQILNTLNLPERHYSGKTLLNFSKKWEKTIKKQYLLSQHSHALNMKDSLLVQMQTLQFEYGQSLSRTIKNKIPQWRKSLVQAQAIAESSLTLVLTQKHALRSSRQQAQMLVQQKLKKMLLDTAPAGIQKGALEIIEKKASKYSSQPMALLKHRITNLIYNSKKEVSL